MNTSNRFEFHGGAGSYLGTCILAWIIIFFTLGFGIPWAIVLFQKWKTDNTTFQGKRLKFHGTGISLIGTWIKWWLFCIITLGIYSFWIMPDLQKWINKNTELM